MVAPAGVVYSPRTAAPSAARPAARVVLPAPGIPSSTTSRPAGCPVPDPVSEECALIIAGLLRRGRGDGREPGRGPGAGGCGSGECPAGDPPHVDQERPCRGAEQDLPAYDGDQLAGQVRGAGDGGHLIPGCGQRTVQAEVCGLVNDTVRRLFNPVGPGQLPADAGARGGDLCGPAGGAGKVPPGGRLGAGWDAFPGQASGGDETLGAADAGVGAGREHDIRNCPLLK